jgi:single-strand DNA-binding protein
MADLKMPEANFVIIAGNLTKDPILRQTTNGSAVINFTIASNRRYRDAHNQWQEDVCYIGVVAWNRLAESCNNRLKKGSAVLVDGELQSRMWKNQEGNTRSVVEIKARHIQFLNKKGPGAESAAEIGHSVVHEDETFTVEDESFDRFLTNEESQLLKGDED